MERGETSDIYKLKFKAKRMRDTNVFYSDKI